jgi:hypothetical protein
LQAGEPRSVSEGDGSGKPYLATRPNVAAWVNAVPLRRESLYVAWRLGILLPFLDGDAATVEVVTQRAEMLTDLFALPEYQNGR